MGKNLFALVGRFLKGGSGSLDILADTFDRIASRQDESKAGYNAATYQKTAPFSK